MTILISFCKYPPIYIIAIFSSIIISNVLSFLVLISLIIYILYSYLHIIFVILFLYYLVHPWYKWYNEIGLQHALLWETLFLWPISMVRTYPILRTLQNVYCYSMWSIVIDVLFFYLVIYLILSYVLIIYYKCIFTFYSICFKFIKWYYSR